MKIEVLVMAAMVALAGGRANAQELAGDLSQLRVLVKPGDSLTVTDTAGQRVRGRLTQLDDSGMVLELGNKELRRFDGDTVNLVEKRGSDSLRNGALIGLATGGTLGVLGGIAIGSEDGNYAGGVLLLMSVYGGIGAAIGVGIDALIEGPRVIYAKSNAKSKTTVSVGPLLTRDRKGIMLTVRR